MIAKCQKFMIVSAVALGLLFAAPSSADAGFVFGSWMGCSISGATYLNGTTQSGYHIVKGNTKAFGCSLDATTIKLDYRNNNGTYVSSYGYGGNSAYTTVYTSYTYLGGAHWWWLDGDYEFGYS